MSHLPLDTLGLCGRHRCTYTYIKSPCSWDIDPSAVPDFYLLYVLVHVSGLLQYWSASHLLSRPIRWYKISAHEFSCAYAVPVRRPGEDVSKIYVGFFVILYLLARKFIKLHDKISYDCLSNTDYKIQTSLGTLNGLSSEMDAILFFTSFDRSPLQKITG